MLAIYCATVTSTDPLTPLQVAVTVEVPFR
jgi:hypothetical protein